MIQAPQGELLDVIGALGIRAASRADCGPPAAASDQNADDRDNDQQLDKRKSLRILETRLQHGFASIESRPGSRSTASSRRVCSPRKV